MMTASPSNLTALTVAMSTLLLTSCGMAWYDKPGLTYEEWKRDDERCQSASRAADGATAASATAYRRCLRDLGYRVPEE